MVGGVGGQRLGGNDSQFACPLLEAHANPRARAQPRISTHRQLQEQGRREKEKVREGPGFLTRVRLHRPRVCTTDAASKTLE